jgi:hypothetical protein
MFSLILVDAFTRSVINKLTETSLFIEDENEIEIRRRIALRSINWNVLHIELVSVSRTVRCLLSP